MRGVGGRSRVWKIAAALVMAAAESWAQSNGGGRRRIVVSLEDRKLALLEEDQVIRVYPVAIGRTSSPTPEGRYEIVHRIPQPTWYYAGKIVPPGKSNPLGTRWLGLSCKGYGIHGTNSPSSVGRRASHGCVRMRNRDVEELYELVKLGDTVELYKARNFETLRIFGPAPEPAKLASVSQTPGGEMYGN